MHSGAIAELHPELIFGKDLPWQGATSQRQPPTVVGREGGRPIAVQTDTDKTTPSPRPEIL